MNDPIASSSSLVPVENLPLALGVMGTSLLLEGYTLVGCVYLYVYGATGDESKYPPLLLLSPCCSLLCMLLLLLFTPSMYGGDIGESGPGY